MPICKHRRPRPSGRRGEACLSALVGDEPTSEGRLSSRTWAATQTSRAYLQSRSSPDHQASGTGILGDLQRLKGHLDGSAVTGEFFHDQAEPSGANMSFSDRSPAAQRRFSLSCANYLKRRRSSRLGPDPRLNVRSEIPTSVVM